MGRALPTRSLPSRAAVSLCALSGICPSHKLVGQIEKAYPAYAFSKRALQATTMAAIDAGARLDSDWPSRGMSDPASLRYRELKRREITWALPT